MLKKVLLVTVSWIFNDMLLCGQSSLICREFYCPRAKKFLITQSSWAIAELHVTYISWQLYVKKSGDTYIPSFKKRSQNVPMGTVMCVTCQPCCKHEDLLILQSCVLYDVCEINHNYPGSFFHWNIICLLQYSPYEVYNTMQLSLVSVVQLLLLYHFIIFPSFQEETQYSLAITLHSLFYPSPGNHELLPVYGFAYPGHFLQMESYDSWSFVSGSFT